MKRYRCANCLEPIETADSMGGRTKACPFCGYQDLVPKSWIQKNAISTEDQTRHAGQEDRSKLRQGPVESRTPHDQIREREPSISVLARVWRSLHDGVGHSTEPNPPISQKRCAECMEWINAQARKCPHCRSTQPVAHGTTAATVLIAALLVGTCVVAPRCLSQRQYEPFTDFAHNRPQTKDTERRIESTSERPPKATSVLFYDPSRTPPYLANMASGHYTREAAIAALADQFDRPADWVKRNMGNSNDLSQIHRNLNRALLREDSRFRHLP